MAAFSLISDPAKIEKKNRDLPEDILKRSFWRFFLESNGTKVQTGHGNTDGANMLFWQALEQLHAWERSNLPGANSALGNEVLIWLLKSKKRPRALKDLYRSSRFSEPTIRSLLRTYSDHGLVVLESDGEDMRSRFARATSKLEQVLIDYRQRFQQLADLTKDNEVLAARQFPEAPDTRPPFTLKVQPTSFLDARARPSRQT